MAIGTPVAIGSVQNKTNQTTTTLTTTAAVPAGATVFLAVASDDASVGNSPIAAAGDVADSVNGAWNGIHKADNQSGASVETALVFIENSAAMSSGAVITVTWNTLNTPTAKALCAFYVTGLALSASLDSTSTSYGNDTAPSVLAAPSTANEELNLCVLGVEGPSGDSFTQDTTPAWATPFPRTGTTGGSAASNITVAGGSFVSTSTAWIYYTPTLGTARNYAAISAVFKAPTATPVSGSDTLTPSIADASAILPGVPSADTLTPSVTESVSISGTLSAADTLTPSIGDVSGVVVVLSRADTLTPSVGEVSAIAVPVNTVDTLTPSVTDVSNSLLLLARADTLTPSVTDVMQCTVQLARVDALIPSVTDAAQVAAVIAAADTLTPSVGETVLIPIVVSSLDTLTPALAELAQTVGAVTGADMLTVALTEDSLPLVQANVTDAFVPSLQDTAAYTLLIFVSDSFMPTLLEEGVWIDFLEYLKTFQAWKDTPSPRSSGFVVYVPNTEGGWTQIYPPARDWTETPE